jgi:hypothetical protein|tara:strand:+ start:249 stop:395 length:147 start_codon:yes stop_codon:yes gene_type:complete
MEDNKDNRILYARDLVKDYFKAHYFKNKLIIKRSKKKIKKHISKKTKK